MATDRPLNLADRRYYRRALLCLLYFCQGVPWGFATIALLATLSQAGHSKAETATVLTLAVMPWTFKLVWAPLIDSLRMPSMGLRRPWIIIAQTGMAVTLFGAVTSGAMESGDTLIYLAWVFFIHNCFASLQDVAADAMAVDLLDDEERGRVNGFMWGTKLVGIAVGGAGMATIIARYDIATAVVIQALIVLSVLVLVIAWRERAGEKRFPWSPGSAQGPGARADFGFLTTLKELKRALSNRTTATAVFLALSFLLCEGLYDPLTTEFFVQDLGWGAERFSQAQGTWGVLGELLGALLGGYLCDRFGRRRVAAFGMVMIMASLLTFGFTAAAWFEPGYPHILLLPAFKGWLAFTTVSLFSLYMKMSWTQAAATQFTLYMATNNLGYALGAKLLSWFDYLNVNLDTAQYYLLAGMVPLLPMLLLTQLDPAGVERKKLAEREALALSAA
jgi:PAT family beta-lactamase induction signal transducer AmpG